MYHMERTFIQDKGLDKTDLEPLRKIDRALTVINHRARSIYKVPGSELLVLNGNRLGIYNPQKEELLVHDIPITVNNPENRSIQTEISNSGKYIVAFRQSGSALVLDGKTGQKLDFELPPNDVGPIVLKRFQQASAADEQLSIMKNQYCGIKEVVFSKGDRYAIVRFKNSTAKVYDFEKQDYITPSQNVFDGELKFVDQDVYFQREYGSQHVVKLEPEDREINKPEERKFNIVLDHNRYFEKGSFGWSVSETRTKATIVLEDVRFVTVSNGRFVLGCNLSPGSPARDYTKIYDFEKEEFIDIETLGKRVSAIAFSSDNRFAYYLTPTLEQNGIALSNRRSQTSEQPQIYQVNLYDFETNEKVNIPNLKIDSSRIDGRVTFVESIDNLLVLMDDDTVFKVDIGKIRQDSDIQSYLQDTGALSTEILTLTKELVRRRTLVPGQQEENWYPFLTGKRGLPVDLLAEVFRLRDIQLSDGGNAVHSSSLASEAFLAFSGQMQFQSRAERSPTRVPEKVTEIPFIYKPEIRELFREAEKAMVFGRTILLEVNGQTVALKLQREGESLRHLVQEGEQMEQLQRLKTELSLRSEYPSPLYDSGNYLRRIKFEYIPEHLRRQINGGLYAFPGANSVVAFPYKVPDGYFSYYTDLETQSAETSTQKTLFDLFKLAKSGLIHPDLIQLFHNQIQLGRSDSGKYIWNVDIVRPMRSRMGAGRLHAWERTIDYPNFGKSGLRDFAELKDFRELYDPLLKNPHVQHLRTNLLRFPDGLKEKIALQYFLGNYMLAWGLAEGRRAKLHEELNWQSPYALAKRVRSAYDIAFQAFTNEEFKDEGLINWERFARQMAFFMTNTYNSYGLLDQPLPNNIFGLGTVKIELGDGWGFMDEDRIRSEIAKLGINNPDECLANYFVKATSDRRDIPDNLLTFKKGWRLASFLSDDSSEFDKLMELEEKYGNGMRSNGIDEDLGPMNGPLPLTEMINANYLLTTLLIDSIS